MESALAMKRLLIVNNMLRGGGVERLLQDLVWEWHDRYEITVMTYEYAEGAAEILPDNVDYISPNILQPDRKDRMSRLWFKVRRRLHRIRFNREFKARHYDAVIAIKDGLVMQRVATMDIPLRLAWNHTDYNSYYYTRYIFASADEERACMQRYKNVVCVSETVRKGIIDTIGDSGNLIVRYNPIPVSRILTLAREPLVDVEEARTPGVTRFVTVGRLNAQKGYDLLLEACHMLERDGYRFEVWVIGGPEPGGEERDRLYRAKERMHVDSVQFLGLRQNPYKYIRCADWFLSSSIFEGYSLVSQEAAVLDVPLLLTDCSGVRELVGDNEYGLIMEISVIGIYEGMRHVMEDPSLHAHYKARIMERKEIVRYKEHIDAIEALLE